MENFYIDSNEDIRDLSGAEIGCIDTEGDFRIVDDLDNQYVEDSIRAELTEEVRDNIENVNYDSRYLTFTGLDTEYFWDWEAGAWRLGV